MKADTLQSVRTIYAPAAALLETLLPKMQSLLGDKLAGVYLYGSLVLGDFDPDISDIDLLAAITDDLTDAEFAALDSLHSEIVAAQPEWVNRVEIAYITSEALWTFKTVTRPLAVISPGES